RHSSLNPKPGVYCLLPFERQHLVDAVLQQFGPTRFSRNAPSLFFFLFTSRPSTGGAAFGDHTFSSFRR
ncbi:hypothetical protein Csa_015089, partial [Cucumis sativus]